MNDLNNKTDGEKTTDQQAASRALSALSEAIRGPRGAKKAAEEAAKAERRRARKEAILAVLTSGDPGVKSENWNARFALTRAVTAVKNGATAEELRECTQLLLVAPWATLVEPVTEYATARGINPTPVLEALCQQAAPEPEPAPQPTAKKPARGRQGRARKEG